MTNREVIASWIEATDMAIDALREWRRKLEEWHQARCSVPYGEFRSASNLLREAGLGEWVNKERAQVPNSDKLAYAVTCLGSDIAFCGRCGREIGPKDDAEVCWFCSGDLCVLCWESHGHCGHQGAEEINQQIREWYAAMEAE